MDSYQSISYGIILFWEHSSTYRKVITILCKYYSYCWIYINDFLCYLLFCFHAWNVYITKIQKKISSHYFVVPGAGLWTAGWFEESYNCCEWGWFIVWNQPVPLRLIFIWYGNHPVFELKLVLGIWHGHKYDCWPLILSTSVLAS